MNTDKINSYCHVCHAVKKTEAESQVITGIEDTTVKKVEKLFQCRECHNATYCSRECQIKDWKNHKPICLTKRQSTGKIEPMTDLEEAYSLIKNEEKFWRGNRKIVMETQFCSSHPYNRTVWWGLFAEFMQSSGLVNHLSDVINCGEGQLALDIGCGNAVSAFYLLKRGWKVIGVDYSQKALNVFEEATSNMNEAWVKTKQLMLVCSPIETYSWPSNVNLVLAGSALSYFNPKKIKKIMEKIHQSLKPGGYFIGNFFAHKYLPSEEIEVERELGAWFVKDETNVKSLLIGHGYDIIKCEHGGQQNYKSIVFIAKK